MIRKQGFLKAVALMCLCFGLLLTGCAEDDASKTDLGVVDLEYYDQKGKQGYNEELFYRNDLETSGADPSCIYVTEGEYEGCFFVYNTYIVGARGIYCMKSKDLTNWEYVDECYVPELDSWGRTEIWAPDIIYDEEDGKYYLFYCANNTNQDAGYTLTKYLGVAVSDSPAGPFVQYTGTNGNGTEIGIGTPLFDVELLGQDHPLYKKGTSIIDPCAFIDPVTGEKYLYMCRSRNAHQTNIICVVKMKDWFTPDYSTYTELTTVNATTYDGSEQTERMEGEINEAPDMLYHDGKYYLTMSINGASEKMYSIIQAVGDSPIGPFKKIQESEGGLALGVNVEWDHIAAPGSHSFVYAGDELFIVYHQNINREAAGDMNRAITIDRMEWVENASGLKLLKAVGPTYSVQPKPSIITGYRNVARDAKVEATNVVNGSSASYLNDGLVQFHESDCVQQFYGENKIKITMDFDDYVTARALLLYNSYDYTDSFYQIERIDLSFRTTVDGKTVTGIARAEELYYDFETYSNIEAQTMRPGGPMILEFAELEINKVTITVTCPQGQDLLGISEIMLLGKECE